MIQDFATLFAAVLSLSLSYWLYMAKVKLVPKKQRS